MNAMSEYNLTKPDYAIFTECRNLLSVNIIVYESMVYVCTCAHSKTDRFIMSESWSRSPYYYDGEYPRRQLSLFVAITAYQWFFAYDTVTTRVNNCPDIANQICQNCMYD